MMRRCALGALLVLVSCSGVSAACLDVRNGGTVELRGTLTYRIFLGPPNFEDVRRGDTPEPDYILKLDKPVCIEGDESVEPGTKADRVQIYVEGEGKAARRLYNELARSRGKKVVAKIASLDVATTAHHHAPLVAALRSIAAEGEADAVPPASQAVVKAFYEALSVGAGEEAARFVVPAKRRSGPLSADDLSRFYGRLEERLELRGIESKSPEEHLVSYRYKPPGAPVCNGRAVVTTTFRRGAAYIAGIQALDGC